MQDPVVIMNFTHIYEDETFFISEQKSSTSRSCEASSTPSNSPAPVSIAASSGPQPCGLHLVCRPTALHRS